MWLAVEINYPSPSYSFSFNTANNPDTAGTLMPKSFPPLLTKVRISHLILSYFLSYHQVQRIFLETFISRFLYLFLIQP